MRQVIGKATRELSADEFASLGAGYDDLVVDVGTGDGKHVLAVARQRPRTLVVGLDAAPDAMRKAAARAAAKPARGGAANAVFVWASVERLPAGLTGAGEVHVLMPWGSLLRAMVAADERALRGIGALCRPGARFLVTLNLHAWRPPVPEVGDSPEPTPELALGPLADAYAQAGWRIDEAEYLSDAQIAELGTSWTRRLYSSRDELAVLGLRGSINP